MNVLVQDRFGPPDVLQFVDVDPPSSPGGGAIEHPVDPPTRSATPTEHR